MKRYARITYNAPGGHRCTDLLELTDEKEHTILGYRVDRKGDRIGGSTGRNYLWIGTHADIISRQDLVMSLKYGWLVPAGQERDGLE